MTQPNSYASTSSPAGRKRAAVLLRRADFLAAVIAEAGDDANPRDRAEESALRWALAKIAELRARLDAARDAASGTAAAEAVALVAKEHPAYPFKPDAEAPAPAATPRTPRTDPTAKGETS